MVDYSKVKLIVTDMDGTLLHSDYTLNPEFFKIYQQLKKLGIKFTVASGRQYESLLAIFESIKDEIFFISENGGNVVYKGERLFVGSIEQKIINEAVELIRPIPNTEILLCGIKNAYVEEAYPEFERYVAPYYPRRKIVPSFSEPIDDEIVKIAIYNNESSEEYILPYVKHLTENYQIKISGKHWLDISIKESNKGSSLKKIQNILQISTEETMVFGDYLNDLEMMEEGYFSYAMENAHPYLQEKARFKTSSNDEDGVLKIMKKLIEQRAV